MTGHPELIAEIGHAIAAAGGRITFARFMELALYHPEHGYYTETARWGHRALPTTSVGRAGEAHRPRLGKAGDYFTSVSVGPLFGQILARQFERWRDDLSPRRATLRRPLAPANRGADGAALSADFEIVEFGGHRGQLRADILAAAPDLNYRVVEVGDPLPETISGVVFSNEFLDALPVHRVCGDQEVYVVARASCPSGKPHGTTNGQDARATVFAEELGPRSDPRLPRLPDGYRSEINLRALDWLTDVSRRLAESAYILTIDYGFDRPEYFAPHHQDGHLQCYYRHTKSGNPYEHIGEQDITAHVEFTSLIEHGRQLGLEPVLFTDQAHFLLDAGHDIIQEIVERNAGQPSRDRNALHQLLHSTMGRMFKVLVQRKANRSQPV